MKKIENISKKKVFDGNQEELKEELTFNINNTEFIIKPTDFIEQPLSELGNMADINLLDILSKERFRLKEGIIKHYCNEDDLNIYFYIQDNFLLLFSFGEWQPSRYILNFESAWEL